MTYFPSLEGKVHYPLPLNPIESNMFMLDKATMKKMVARMSQTLQDFSSSDAAASSAGFSQAGRRTAQEFFSKENRHHPLMQENESLMSKLHMLEEAKSMSGAVGQAQLTQQKSMIEK